MPELERPTRPRKRTFRPYRLLSEQELRSLRRRRRARNLLILAALVMVAGLYAYAYYSSFYVRTTHAHVGTRSAALAAKSAGRVSKVLVGATQAVKIGDPLVQLDEKELQATLNERQSELDRNEQRLAGGRIYLERLQKGLATGDAAARDKYENSRKWLYRLEAKTRSQREGVAEARRHLSEATIRAPADGYVAKTLVAAGATVSVGQPVAEFVGLGQPWVIADYRAVQLEKVKVGQHARIHVDGISKTFDGTVEILEAGFQPPPPRTAFEKLSDWVTPNPVRVPVRIAFDPKSIEGSVNRMVNGAQATVRVYIK